MHTSSGQNIDAIDYNTKAHTAHCLFLWKVLNMLFKQAFYKNLTLQEVQCTLYSISVYFRTILLPSNLLNYQ